MKKVSIILAIICILFIACESKRKDKDLTRTPVLNAIRPFQGTFALTWFGGFCFSNQQSGSTSCTQNTLNRWDGQSFTIHGLWPSARRSNDSYKNFDISSITDAKLIDDLQNYWPPQYNQHYKKTNQLWFHEYNKHGKDFVNIIQVSNRQKYIRASNAELQSIYFKTAVEYYKTLSVTKIQKRLETSDRSKQQALFLNKQTLSALIEVPSDNFLIECRGYDGGDFLVQIKVCVQIKSNLQIEQISCSNIRNARQTEYPYEDKCDDEFELIGFRENDESDRVTKQRPNRNIIKANDAQPQKEQEQTGEQI